MLCSARSPWRSPSHHERTAEAASMAGSALEWARSKIGATNTDGPGGRGSPGSQRSGPGAAAAGDHAGIPSATADRVRRVAQLPSALTAHSSDCHGLRWPRPEVNSRRLPSGDHAPAVSGARANVSRRGSLPSAVIV
jgi:hypothetical protein